MYRVLTLRYTEGDEFNFCPYLVLLTYFQIRMHDKVNRA